MMSSILAEPPPPTATNSSSISTNRARQSEDDSINQQKHADKDGSRAALSDEIRGTPKGGTDEGVNTENGTPSALKCFAEQPQI